MKCMWCDSAHATCMLSHVLRVKGSGAQACKGKIHPDEHKQYMMLYQKGKGKSEARKPVSDDVVDIVDGIQQSATASIQFVCKKQHTDQIVESNQTCIEAGFERAVSNDIQRSYDAGLEMVVMAFFHCENIPDNVIKLNWIKKMLQQVRLIGKDFNIPDRRKIGGKYFIQFLFLFYLQ